MKKLIEKLLSSIYKELIYGAHLVAIGAIGITLTSIIIFELDVKIIILAIMYIIFQIIYRYNYYRELKFDLETNPERAKHIISKKRLMGSILTIYGIVLFLLLCLTNIETLALGLFIAFAGILYTEYFKKIPILGFKNYYTSFVWALSTFLIPLFYEKNLAINIYIFLFIFLRGIVNTVFFDIKDIESDKERGVKTLPAHIGKKKTIYLLQLINILSFLPILVGVFTEQLSVASLFLSFTVLNGIFYLTWTLNISNVKLRTLSYILIDGEYILWPLILIVGGYLI